MSDNPGTKKAAVQSPNGSDSATFEAKVLDIVKNLNRDEDGKVVWSDDIGEAEKFAASQVLRYRDTQSSYTKGQQTIQSLEAEKTELLKQIQRQAKLEISQEEQDRLDDLRVDDPDKWRVEVNKLEAEAQKENNQRVEEALKAAGSEAVKKNELKRRENILAEFNKEHNDLLITDDVIANDVPPRIINKLEKGDISFEDFLDEVYTYVKKGKTVQNAETMNQPNLSLSGGGLTPSKANTKANISEKYRKRVY